MGENMDVTAQAIATDIATRYVDSPEGETEWQAEGPRRETHPGRFSFLYLTAPNGQTFKVTVEEL
jgi:hypothetical protein